MVVDDYGEMVVEDGSLLVLEAELVSILILELASLEISEHRGGWKVICQPTTHTCTHTQLKKKKKS